MSYLAKLLDGYRQGLTCPEPEPVDVLRRHLAGGDDPIQRGTLLGLMARALAERDRGCMKVADMIVEAAPDGTGRPPG